MWSCGASRRRSYPSRRCFSSERLRHFRPPRRRTHQARAHGIVENSVRGECWRFFCSIFAQRFAPAPGPSLRSTRLPCPQSGAVTPYAFLCRQLTPFACAVRSSYDYRRSWACVLLTMLLLPAAGSCSAAVGRRYFFESPAGSRSTSAPAMAHELALELPSSRRSSSTCSYSRSCCRCRCRRRCCSHRRRRRRRRQPAPSPLLPPPPPPLSCSRASVRLRGRAHGCIDHGGVHAMKSRESSECYK